MRFLETPLSGAYVIELDRIEDERGFFARAFCAEELVAHGLNPRVAQCNVSFNRRRGTLRGMHWQGPPHEESKLVRCTAGALYDVIVDVRPGSPTYRSWFCAELTADNRRMLYVPEGFAHGFQTLADDTEIFYMMGDSYHPECARGVRFDDPQLAIRWPIADPQVSDRDRALPNGVL